tara:strand:+ start:1246 stop:1728 length:483 start_codon:yes stop_codon:yes gene_type:complete
MDKAVREIGIILSKNNLTLCTAESFTSGNIAAAITSEPGASEYFIGGVVAYTEEIKQNILGVDTKTLEEKGTVHVNTVVEMAKGAADLMNADYALATTGLAGPGGGTDETPVGTVFLAIYGPGFLNSYSDVIEGSRKEVVEKATALILNRFRNILTNWTE